MGNIFVLNWCKFLLSMLLISHMMDVYSCHPRIPLMSRVSGNVQRNDNDLPRRNLHTDDSIYFPDDEIFRPKFPKKTDSEPAIVNRFLFNTPSRCREGFMMINDRCRALV